MDKKSIQDSLNGLTLAPLPEKFDRLSISYGDHPDMPEAFLHSMTCKCGDSVLKEYFVYSISRQDHG
jgi:hypothetical protein